MDRHGVERMISIHTLPGDLDSAGRGLLMHEFTHPQPTKPKHDLTERELEVLRLISLGKSNKDIADELVLSEKTVKTHVSNILQKLHLSDRTQAAVFAWQQGLMRKEP